MNISIAILTLIILIITLLYQIKIWKVRVLLSPGFYFSIIWILGVIGLLVFKTIGILLESNPEYIDELNILISFTGVCFIIVTKIGVKNINSKIIIVNYFASFRFFKFLSAFFFILALYVFFIEGSGLDFGKARDNMHETIENRSFLVGYFRLLSIPLSIYAGNKFMKLFLKIESTSLIKNIFLILPFIANILFSLTEGGRVAMVYGLMLYIVGAVLILPMNFNINGKKKIFFYSFIVLMSVNVLISWIGSVRDAADGNSYRTDLIDEQLGSFAFLRGAMDYVYSSYVGYQLRREDAVGPRLGFGQYTFNGFINWQLPFAGRFGLKDASIAKEFDIYYDNQETYDLIREQYDTTHSAYIPIIKDFGFRGAFFAIFFIVYFSHLFFVKIQKRRSLRYSVNFYFYYLFLIYWAKSNFYGTLSESILIPLYGFLIVDIFNNIIPRKK